jgi:hypothetical protein
MGRGAGTLNRKTESLIRAVSHASGDDLLERLSHVMDDESLPLKMRLDALRYLSGYLHGRVRINASAKERIAEIIKQQAQP